MKIALFGLGFIIIAVLYFPVVAIISRMGSTPGMQNGQLQACSWRPNCICSEFADDKRHYREPIDVSSQDNPLEQAAASIEAMGGEIVKREGSYIAATFTSDGLKYIDDFEVRLDADKQQLHYRSASRVGIKDFGVNIKRVKAFKEMYSKTGQP